MLFFGLKQFCADSPKTVALDCLDFHWDIIQVSVEGFDTRDIRFRTEHHPMPSPPQHIQDGTFIITLAHVIDPFRLGVFVLYVYSTNTARFFIARNLKIITILEQPEEFFVVFLTLQI